MKTERSGLAKQRLSALPAVLFGVAIAITACGEEQVEESKPEPTMVGVIEVTPRSVVDWIVLPADLAPERRAVLAAEVPGRVEAMRVDIGDDVRRGTSIASIDRRTLAQQVAEAEAFHRRASEEAKRAETLFAKRSITRQALTEAQTGIEIAAARLASARLALEKSTVRAPWNGRVAQRWAEVGDYLQPGQPVVELVADRTLEVRAPLAAPDAPLVEVGRPVELAVEGFSDEVFRGEITRVGATLDTTSRTLEVEAEIDNRDGRLKAGMYGQIRFPRRTHDGALLVPLPALIDVETGKILYVVDGSTVRRVEPELGAILGEEVIVRSGLRAGDRVVVEGQYRVNEGMEVSTELRGSEPDPEPDSAPGDRASEPAGIEAEATS